jgi:hypothetical protein
MAASNSFHRKVQKLEDARCRLTDTALRDEQTAAVDRRRQRSEIARAVRLDEAGLEAAGLNAAELIDAAIDAGVDAESFAALHLAPLAVVAWASGGVSKDENRAAAKSSAEFELVGNAAAIELFESWLIKRPRGDLLRLWRNVHRHACTEQSPAVHHARLQRLHHLATGIAMASGGVLGFDKICPAEQVVLDVIDSEIQWAAAQRPRTPEPSTPKMDPQKSTA